MTNSSTALTASSKIILVTGASSGIGKATARLLAAQGHRLVIGARREERIAAIAAEIREQGGDARFCVLDVTSLASFQAFARAALNEYGRIDVLVNNAGVMPLSMVAELRVDDWNAMIDVNLKGVLHGIASVLPAMQAQASGHIVNVASVSGHRVDPSAAVYCATKFAVRALSEGLRQESRDVRVTIVSPGLTRSALTQGIPDPHVRQAVDQMMEQSSMPAEAVAEGIAFAIAQPRNIDVNELVLRPTAQG